MELFTSNGKNKFSGSNFPGQRGCIWLREIFLGAGEIIVMIRMFGDGFQFPNTGKLSYGSFSFVKLTARRPIGANMVGMLIYSSCPMIL